MSALIPSKTFISAAVWRELFEAGLIVDLFAGGGGASTGIEAALKRGVDIAINHDPVALAAHKRNHHETRHLEANLWEVRPREATGGKPVFLLWASPDCKDFSVAKGGRPREQGIRSLAWVVVEWARDTLPVIICLENVREFEGWGPLDENGKRIKARIGEEFQKFVEALRQLGYVVDWRPMDASQYGAPTRRKRLFLVARRDGMPIVWPGATHGPGLKPFHTAAECIDWTRTCPSIFERKKPLAEKTLWRIAQGIKRFVLENPRPFIVGAGGRARQTNPVSVTEPVGTITTKNDRAVVLPVIARYNGDRVGQPPDEPLTTVDTSNRFGVIAPHLAKLKGDAHSSGPEAPVPTVTAQGPGLGVVAPHLVKVNHGKREPRGESLELPLSTVTAGQRGHALVAPIIARTAHGDVDSNGKRRGQGAHSVEEPIGAVPAGGTDFAVVAPVLATIDQQSRRQATSSPDAPLPTTVVKNRHAVIAPALVRTDMHKSNSGCNYSPEDPLRTITSAGGFGVVAPTLVEMNHSNAPQDVAAPLGTVTTQGNRFNLVAASMIQTSYGEREGQRARTLDLEAPLGTVVAQGQKHAVVAAFLNKHFGDPLRTDGGGGVVLGSELTEPLGTVTTRDHHTVTAAHMVKLRGDCHSSGADEPVPTISAGGERGGRHIAEVRAFLTAYYGDDHTPGKGQDLFEPMRTIPTNDRFGLVVVEGIEYAIVDIGFRMLEPDELKRAQFGRFAEGYDLSDAKTKKDQIRLIGNSVSPENAEALVLAQVEPGLRRAA